VSGVLHPPPEGLWLAHGAMAAPFGLGYPGRMLRSAAFLLSLLSLPACTPRVGGPAVPTDSGGPVDTADSGVPTDTDDSGEPDDSGDTADTTDTGPVDDDCPVFEGPSVAGQLDWGEVSGLVAASHGGFLWGHSDAQGRAAEIQAIDTDGGLLGSFLLDGASNTDWEDIARGPGPIDGASYLYIADTGDNGTSRSGVQVYRFLEPSQAGGGVIDDVERLELRYPDGAHDAETLLVDPISGDLILVERDRDDQGVSGIFLAEAPLSSEGITELERVGTLVFGSGPLPGDVDATAGDVSADGSLVMVRTHDRIWVFLRDPQAPIQEAFDSTPCPTPAVDEYKGEALAIAVDGSGFYTGGEGRGEPLHWFAAE
jgi:hypothetical protein